MDRIGDVVIDYFYSLDGKCLERMPTWYRFSPTRVVAMHWFGCGRSSMLKIEQVENIDLTDFQLS